MSKFTERILHSQNVEDRCQDKKVREVEAEAVAFVVSQGIGLNLNTAGSDYIQLYSGDRKTLVQSLDRIQKTASEILAGILENQPISRIRTGEQAAESAKAA